MQHHVLSHTCRRLPIIILMPEEEGRQKKRKGEEKKEGKTRGRTSLAVLYPRRCEMSHR
jgi:hypothetical protein